jgi:hypothetical protein
MDAAFLVEIYRPSNHFEAYFLNQALKEAGIRSAIHGEFAAMEFAASSSIPWEHAPKLMVLEGDAESARRVVEDAVSRTDIRTTE